MIFDKTGHSGRTDFSGICAACATPPGQSGIAVIRLSGLGSDQAADQIFRAAGNNPVSVQRMQPYTCAYGQVIDPRSDTMIDQVVLTRFKAPHSYTGEDLIEISCHGGYAVKKSILELLFSMGISPAQPGEFTQRAFINGKLDLVQAEAVMDLIQAGAEKAAAAATAQLQGALSAKVRQIADSLYQVQAELELILEFPEHEDGDTVGVDLSSRLQKICAEIDRLAASYRQGRILREGLTVAIAGRPNAGKSSLLNALAGFDRAIVTPIPGTTRDTVEEIVNIDGLPVRLIDTAGMRDTADLVEQHGVSRARAALGQADLVFWLISPPLQDLSAEKAEITAAGCTSLILIAGKEDLEDSRQVRQRINELFTGIPVLTFSALRSDGLDAIRQAIKDYYEKSGSGSSQHIIVTNSRHQACLLEASEALAGAVAAIDQSVPLDMAAALMRGCAEALARLTGDTVSDTLVETIFSRFCVGK